MLISQKLKEARAKAGLTQEKVAEAIHVSRQTVSNWETAKSYPDIASLIRLSDLYGVSLDDLLKGDAEMIRHFDDRANAVKKLKGLGLGAGILLAIGLLVECFVRLVFPGSSSITLDGSGIAIHGAAAVIYADLLLAASLVGIVVLLVRWSRRKKEAGTAGPPASARLTLCLRLLGLALVAVCSFMIIW